MKKGSKPVILYTILVSTILALLILAYVALKVECEELAKAKVVASEKLNIVNNNRVNLVAQKQYFGSEERIVKIAKEELGMVEGTVPVMILKADKNKIEKIRKVINQKYEQ